MELRVHCHSAIRLRELVGSLLSSELQRSLKRATSIKGDMGEVLNFHTLQPNSGLRYDEHGELVDDLNILRYDETTGESDMDSL